MATITTDISRRKRTEARLRASEARLRRFAEHSANVLWVADLQCRRIEYASPAFEQVWGMPQAAMPDLGSWIATIHAEDRASARHALEQAAQGEACVLEYRILRPSDGVVRRVRDALFPIRDEDARVRRVGGIAEDVTGHAGSRVYVVAGVDSSREMLAGLLQAAGYEVQAFESGRKLREVAHVLMPGCVVLDLDSTGAGGFAVSKQLRASGLSLPVVAVGLSGGDVGFGVRAMKAGAIDYLEKPCAAEAVLPAVAAAMAEIRADAGRERACEEARARVAGLSPRERDVLERLLAGGTNKSIGRALGLSPRTVEIHRAHVMESLGARTFPEAILTATAGGVRPARVDQ